MAADEEQRLSVLRRYGLIDTPPDGNFDRITRIAAELFSVPIAVVSLIDEDRIWLKSGVGLGGLTELPKDPGLCASAYLSEGVYLVEDARIDPRTLANPLVAGEMGLRFYAAAPLVTADGYRLGNLAILDFEPRTLAERERHLLEELACVVVDEMEMRLAARHEVTSEYRRRLEAEDAARELQAALLPPRLPEIDGFDLAATYRPANAGVVGGDFYDVFQAPDGSWFMVMGDVCGKGPRAAAVTVAGRYAVRAEAMRERDPAAILALMNDALISADEDHFACQWCTVVVARVDPAPGPRGGVMVHVASGGHPRPRVLTASGRVVALGGEGFLVGAVPEATFSTSSMELGAGDGVVMFTDGVTEAKVPEGLFGTERLDSALRKAAGMPPDEVIAAVGESLAAAGAVQVDDIALLALRVR